MRSLCRRKRQSRCRLELGARVVVGLAELFLGVVVAAGEDGTLPFLNEALGLALDVDFWTLGLGVEEDDLADAAADESFFVDGELGKAVKEVALDVVGGEGAIFQRLEEEADRFEEVVFWIHDVALDGGSRYQRDHFRKELQFVHCGFAFTAGFHVGLGSIGHAVAEFVDFGIGLCFKVLVEVR